MWSCALMAEIRGDRRTLDYAGEARRRRQILLAGDDAFDTEIGTALARHSRSNICRPCFMPARIGRDIGRGCGCGGAAGEL
jgi:hypothetical protein